jgi:hypothetical protein
VQVVDGALRVGSSGEDRAIIILQDLQPKGEVGGVIGADLWRGFEIGTR